MHRRTIALLTDFGLLDPYAGVLKAVIADIAPEAQIIDLSHGVPRGDVRRGAHMLWQAGPYLPAGAILLCVIDPGVGSQRPAVALQWSGCHYVGPDNGLASYLIARDGEPAAYRLEEPSYRLSAVSNTFHGRDLFAPAAAHLAAGVLAAELGPPTQDLVRLPHPRLELGPENEVVGEVLHADSFGNVVTSLGILAEPTGSKSPASLRFAWLRPWLGQMSEIELRPGKQSVRLPAGRRIDLVETFSDVPQNEPLAYAGSDGLLEIGINRGNAAQALSLSPGDEVVFVAQG